jgi:SAM-dependent methyltransferase
LFRGSLTILTNAHTVNQQYYRTEFAAGSPLLPGIGIVLQEDRPRPEWLTFLMYLTTQLAFENRFVYPEIINTGIHIRSDIFMWPIKIRVYLLFPVLLLLTSQAYSQAIDFTPPIREPDVGYVPTPHEVVDAMLKVAGVGEDDIVYDLGSGDGRIVIAAARDYGARGVGIDINPRRIREARENAEIEKVTDRVTFIQGDIFVEDISEATVVTLYLLSELNLRLRPRLLNELEPGTRIVSHAFSMGDWRPVKTLLINEKLVYYWVVP